MVQIVFRWFIILHYSQKIVFDKWIFNVKWILGQCMGHLLITVKQSTFDRFLPLRDWSLLFHRLFVHTKLHICFLNLKPKCHCTETMVCIEVSCSWHSEIFILMWLLVVQDHYCKHCYLKGRSGSFIKYFGSWSFGYFGSASFVEDSGSFKKCFSIAKDWDNHIHVF